MQTERRAMLTLASLAIPGTLLRAQPFVEEEQRLIDRTDRAARNAAIIRRHHDVLNRGDILAAAEFFSKDTRNHGVLVGRQGVFRVLNDIETTFPDWHMDIEELSAVGDDVIVRAIVTGTHKGVARMPVNGGLLVGVPPSGNTFKVQHIHWYALKAGLIVEHRACRDDVGMMQQLGLLPSVKRYDLPQK